MRKGSTNDGLLHFIKQAWEITHERAKTLKALRILERQTWSVEFLSALLVRAARQYGSALEMEIHSKDGASIVVRTADDRAKNVFKDDDIFNNLDDENKVQQFVAALQRRTS